MNLNGIFLRKRHQKPTIHIKPNIVIVCVRFVIANCIYFLMRNFDKRAFENVDKKAVGTSLSVLILIIN